MSTADRGFTGLDDERLVPGVRGGDPMAYRYLYETSLPLLLRFAYHICGSRDQAEEAAQAVLVEIWISRTRWRPGGAVLAYLYRAVRNHILDTVRHDHVVLRTEGGMDIDAPYGMGGAPVPADAFVESLDTITIVSAAIQDLPERQRTAVLLRWYDGMTTAGIAEVMGISRQVVERLLGKAHHKLRVALRDVGTRG